LLAKNLHQGFVDGIVHWREDTLLGDGAVEHCLGSYLKITINILWSAAEKEGVY
jgi:hypothetical protein